MTSVEFYSGIQDKSASVVRLLRKAVGKGARVAVMGEAVALNALDSDLWTADPGDFVPHVRMTPGKAIDARLHRTPIWLVEASTDAPHCTVLVNLGPNFPASLQGFERIIEMVGLEPADRDAGRQRWRRYESMSLPIQHHPKTASSAGAAA